MLAAILYRSGDFNGALVQLDQLKRDNFFRENSLHFLAMTKWQLGDQAGARKVPRGGTRSNECFATFGRNRFGYPANFHWYEWAELAALDAEASNLIRL